VSEQTLGGRLDTRKGSIERLIGFGVVKLYRSKLAFAMMIGIGGSRLWALLAFSVTHYVTVPFVIQHDSLRKHYSK